MGIHLDKRTIVLKGIGVSPGIAVGKAFVFDRLDAQVSLYKLSDASLISKEIRRFKRALRESEKELTDVRNRLRDLGGLEPLYIIDVHIMILRDRMFIQRTVDHIREMRVNTEWAIRMTIDQYRAMFDKVEDEYLRGRISDIQYAGQLLIRVLAGGKKRVIADLGEGLIVIAKDLSPADTAQMKIDKVLGFATDVGGKTSHTAIVARSIEIPAVVGLNQITREVRTNDEVIIDGYSGLVIIHPDPEVVKRYQERKRHYIEAQEVWLKDATLPARTIDGYRVDIGGNIEFVEEIPTATVHGADGIGLYRTEFIYINRESLPTEEDHLTIYRQVAAASKLRWVTIRTFDLGGDKFYSDPKLSREMNPQMGLRAIRFCLKEEDHFRTQLRAILRASVFGKIRIMFPMISGIEEIREAKRIYSQVREGLLQEGIAVADDVELGVMIEVPSAVVIADALAKEVHFFSIGTNDLIQYALAIDRINDQVAYLYQPLHPAVLRMIRQVVDAGHRAGIRVAMCGEMAGEPLYTLILLGLELDELSMTPLAIPRVKKIIRAATLAESKKLLDRVMLFSSAEEIREWVTQYMMDRFPEEFQMGEQ